MDISQNLRLEVINTINRKKWRPEISPEGFCNGDALVWALSRYDGKSQEYNEMSDIIVDPNLDLEKLENNHLSYINNFSNYNNETSSMSEMIKKDHENYLKIMKYYDGIMFGQEGFTIIDDANQSDWHQFINIAENLTEPELFLTSELFKDKTAKIGKIYLEKVNDKELKFVIKKSIDKTIEGTLEINNIGELTQGFLQERKDEILKKTSDLGHTPVPFVKEFYMPFVTSKNNVLTLLNTMLPSNKIIKIARPKHAMSIYNDGQTYYFFDPNSKMGEVSARSLKELEPIIIDKLASTGDETNISFNVTIVDLKNNIRNFKYPDVNSLVNFSIENNKFNTKNGLSVLNDLSHNNHTLFKTIFKSKIIDINLSNSIELIVIMSNIKNADLYYAAKESGFSFDEKTKEFFIKELITNGNLTVLEDVLKTTPGNFNKYLIHYLENSAEFNVFKVITDKMGGPQAVLDQYKSNTDWSTEVYGEFERNLLHYAVNSNDPTFFKTVNEKYPNLLIKKDNKGLDPFELAIETGNTKLVQYLIKEGIVNFNQYQQDPKNLALAINSKNSEMLELLYKLGMTEQVEHYKDAQGNTLLHLAAKKDDWKMMKLLLQDEMLQKNNEGLTPFDIALEAGNSTLVNYLLDSNIYKLSENNHYLTHAFKSGNNDFIFYQLLSKELKDRPEFKLFNNYLINLLFDKNIDSLNAFRAGDFSQHLGEMINWIIKQENSAELFNFIFNQKSFDFQNNPYVQVLLNWSIDSNKPAVFELLLSKGVNPQESNPEYLNKILSSSHLDQEKYFDILMKNPNFDLNKEKIYGSPILLFALRINNAKLVDILIKKGASINIIDSNMNQNILHIAASMGRKDILELGLKGGLSTEVVDINGNTPIKNAVQSNQADCIDLLLKYNADLKAMSPSNETILHTAASVGNIKILTTCLEAGLDVNIQTKIEDDLNQEPETAVVATSEGETALMRAVQSNQTQAFRFLIKHNANYKLKNKNNESIFHVATNIGNVEVVNYCLEKGLDLNEPNVYGKTPFMNAIELNNVENIDLLINNAKPNFNLKDKEMNSILHFAAQNGNLALLEQGIKAGLNINDENTVGQTPLIKAIQFGQSEEMIDILIKQGADFKKVNKLGNSALFYFIQTNFHNLGKLTDFFKKNQDIVNLKMIEPILVDLPSYYSPEVKLLLEQQRDLTKEREAILPVPTKNFTATFKKLSSDNKVDNSVKSEISIETLPTSPRRK